MGGDGADTVAFDSALAVTSDEGVMAAGAGADSLGFAAITGGSIFGGSSFGDTAAGNDTLEFTGHASATKIDMGSGTNFVTGEGALNGSSVYGGADKDTFVFSGKDSLNSARVGTGDGIDSLVLHHCFHLWATIINMGAGNDTLEFGNSVSATSILGGAGNDRVNFAGGALLAPVLVQPARY